MCGNGKEKNIVSRGVTHQRACVLVTPGKCISAEILFRDSEIIIQDSAG